MAEPPDQKLVPSSHFHAPSDTESEPPAQIYPDANIDDAADMTAVWSALECIDTSRVPSEAQCALAAAHVLPVLCAVSCWIEPDTSKPDASIVSGAASYQEPPGLPPPAERPRQVFRDAEVSGLAHVRTTTPR